MADSSSAEQTVLRLISDFSGPLTTDEVGARMLDWACRLTDASDALFLPPKRPNPNPNAEASLQSGRVIHQTGDATTGPALYAPLLTDGKAAAVVRVSRAAGEGGFDGAAAPWLEVVTQLGAQALENARLRAAQRQILDRARLSTLGELSAIIAHQIKNPLTTILGDAELLIEILPPGDAAESAQAILRAGQRAQEIVNRVLGQVHPTPEPRPVDVNRTVEEAVALVGDTLSPYAALTLHLDNGLPPVSGVAAQLIDVWLNLLSNSRDALREQGTPGEIRLTSSADASDGVAVTVQDTGPGIPPEALTRVFEPFYTTKPLGQGTGLGLYVCQRTVTDLGGHIDVTSTPGSGTVVSVWLPSQTAAEEG